LAQIFLIQLQFLRRDLDEWTIGFHVSRMALNLTEDSFQSEVIDSDLPVLVDFWAEWCGPCKMIGPVLEQLSAEVEGQAKITKVNVDDARSLAVKYNVKSIPLLLFFKNGEVKDQIVGANVTKDMLKAKLLALA
jgi:thioredoxin 1